MDALIQKFMDEVDLKFNFLEKEYGYTKIEGNIENEQYYPDAQAVVKYIGKSLSVEVYWYFAGANIGVAFIEHINGKVAAKRAFFGGSKDCARAITLYSLAGFLKKEADSSFLLFDIDNVTIPKIKKREKVINENMSGVVEGLSSTVKRLAINIIAGDISIFGDVMNYQTKLLDKQYS